jgi:hypothetical protein
LQDLERRRQLEEDKYRYFQSSLEKARLDETLDPNKIPNISVVQSPSPPEKSVDAAAMKLILGIASSGLMVGLALAFLTEMVIDRRVSSPVEIRTRLQLPLMMSIPYIRSKDAIGKLIGTGADRGLPGYSEAIRLAPDSRSNGTPITDRSGEHFITPYVAAIHDRIIFNFQINNITHKPKLVALTGLSQGAGTSTIAAGLARAFADNGDRKVLLVNLDPENARRAGISFEFTLQGAGGFTVRAVSRGIEKPLFRERLDASGWQQLPRAGAGGPSPPHAAARGE